jgi:lysophospholipase L1-like esterase
VIAVSFNSTRMTHVVLLGDSVFDNQAYIAADEPAVIKQLQARLPENWQATLIAVDGSITTDIPAQLEGLPSDATHLVVSVGGNDALQHIDVLYDAARSVAEVYSRVAAIGEQFERDYRRMPAAVRSRHLPTAVCTIYFPSFPDPAVQRLAVTGLTVFNDCILQVAFECGLPVLDLRLICTAPTDYANPIEPSAAGGAKIAAAIATVVAEHDFSRGRTEVFIHSPAHSS